MPLRFNHVLLRIPEVQAWTDTMATPNKIEIPREYWAFRLGRLIAQLPRKIEYAFFHGSTPLESTAYYEPQLHVGGITKVEQGISYFEVRFPETCRLASTCSSLG